MKTMINRIILFFKENFSISSNRFSKITGVCLAVVLSGVIAIFSNSFVNSELSARWLLFSLAYILALLIGLIAAYGIKIENKTLKKVGLVISFIIFPLLTIMMTECLNGIWVYDMTILGFVGNLAIVMLFYFFVYAVSGSLRVSILSISSVLYGFALAHAYIMSFRSTPFIPMDFLGVTTAINVGSTYDYTPSEIIILGSLIYILLVVIGIRVSTPKLHLLTKLISRSFTGILFVVIFAIFYFTDVFAKAGIKPDFWNQARGYRNYGFVYNYVCNTKYLYYPKPKNYKPENTSKLVSEKSSKYNFSSSNADNKKEKPNIICIMNESLSDLSVLGNFSTNADYMPFIRSLKENTIKGNLYVPVIGAGTSNTEFEFLTGHTTAFLPSGSNAYMLYIKNPMASIVSTLEAQGYSSAAFHPYYASGWNRVNVYNNMGFDTFKSIENLLDPNILNEYMKNSSSPDKLQKMINTAYPDRQNMLIRQYVSDEYDFDIIIDDFKNRDKQKPYFMFNVTMQNHGGYLTESETFERNITLSDTTSVNYEKTNNYLSLIKKSDEAFEKLINYFKGVDEHTIICMFGDHQPSIESDFVANTIGVDDLTRLTVEQEQSRHITPFIIWANYDIEEKEIDKLSSNYLASYLLQTAGVELSNYDKYLLELSKELPVIDTVGYIDNKGVYYKWSSNSEYSNILENYELIQYNNIFDYEHNDNASFFINGYSVDVIAEEIKKKNGGKPEK